MAASTIGTLIVAVTLSILVLLLSANFVPYVQIGLGVAKQTFGEVAWSYAYKYIVECSVLALEGYWKTGAEYTCRAVLDLSNPVSLRIENNKLLFSTPSGKAAVSVKHLKETLSSITGVPSSLIEVSVFEKASSRLIVSVSASKLGLRVELEPA